MLRARGHDRSVEWFDREPRRFESREALEGYLRRQLWVKEGSAADRRFLDALDGIVVSDDEGRVALSHQRALPLGIVTWAPTAR